MKNITRNFVLGQVIVFLVGCSAIPDIKLTITERNESDSQPAPPPTAKNYHDIKRSVVKISSEKYGKRKNGTGFIIQYNDKKYIITASHVLQEGDNNPTIIFLGDNETEAIVKTMEIVDQGRGENILPGDSLALLSVKDIPMKMLPLFLSKSENLEKREDVVFTLGFPNSSPFLAEPAYERLNYSGKNAKQLLFFSNSAYSGNYGEGISGSPVIQGNEVVGVITGHLMNYLLARPVRNINEFLSTNLGNEQRGGPLLKPFFHRKPSCLAFDALSGGGKGPKVIEITGGDFSMGDNYGDGEDDEKPVRAEVVNSFMMGCYEVSFDEYDKFAENTRRKKPNDNGWGRGNLPVINVSWDDANDYTKWLSEKTGQKYRLPTEEEWEYAARGRTTTKYWWGDDANVKKANCCTDGWVGKTILVDSLGSNPFGLFNILGNVKEWTCSITEHNSVCPDENNPRVRKIRGGSWNSGAGYVRVSNRAGEPKDVKSEFIGFRVVRELGSDM